MSTPGKHRQHSEPHGDALSGRASPATKKNSARSLRQPDSRGEKRKKQFRHPLASSVLIAEKTVTQISDLSATKDAAKSNGRTFST